MAANLGARVRRHALEHLLSVGLVEEGRTAERDRDRVGTQLDDLIEQPREERRLFRSEVRVQHRRVLPARFAPIAIRFHGACVESVGRTHEA